jgi:hypothetical protein
MGATPVACPEYVDGGFAVLLVKEASPVRLASAGFFVSAG